jgi:hypothetical protein
MKPFPDVLIVSAISRGRGLGGAWVRVTLGTTERNDFNLLLGPADPQGRLVVKRQEILNQIQEIRDLFIMDYGGPDAWNGTMNVAVLNRDDVSRALSAFDLWGKAVGIQSQGDLGRLKEFGDALETLGGEELFVTVETRPQDAAVVKEVVSRA